jgi:hypothetical protein
MNRNIFLAVVAILFIYFSGVFISSKYYESYTKTMYGQEKLKEDKGGYTFYYEPVIGHKQVPASYEFQWNPVQWDIAGKAIFTIAILIVFVVLSVAWLNQESEDVEIAGDPDVLTD